MVSSRRTWTFVGFVLGAVVLAPVTVRDAAAQDATPDSAKGGQISTPSAADESPPDRDSSDPDQREKRRKALAAVYLLGGLAFVGGALCMLVIMWGRRVRRMVRTPTRAQQPPDEFWYLRTNPMKKRLERKQAQRTLDADTTETDSP